MAVDPKKAAKAKARPRSAGQRIPAADFKATCLKLMDRVRETRTEYVVTKHGRPVAKLVPYSEPVRKPFVGSLQGTVLAYDRPFDPVEGDWDVNRD